MAEKEARGFVTPQEIPDNVWDANVRRWRATADRQWRMDMERADLDRQTARAVVSTGARWADELRDSRAGKAVSALFRDQPGKTDEETGALNLATVNQRRGQVQADIQRNLDAARMSGYPEAQAGAWPAAAASWLGRVWPDGEWDDRVWGDRFERQGNFSYGATAEALGLPEAAALRGAGLAQRGRNAWRALNGKPPGRSIGFFDTPYGDDPRDQFPISQGHAYGRVRTSQRR